MQLNKMCLKRLPNSTNSELLFITFRPISTCSIKNTTFYPPTFTSNNIATNSHNPLLYSLI